jgi:hypothetical protein
MRMVYLGRLDHPRGVIRTQIRMRMIFSLLTLLDEAAVSTSDIEDTRTPSSSEVIDNLIYLGPRVIAPTLRECICETIIECHSESIVVKRILPSFQKKTP